MYMRKSNYHEIVKLVEDGKWTVYMNKGGEPSTLTTIYRVEMFFNLTGQSTMKMGILNQKNRAYVPIQYL